MRGDVHRLTAPRGTRDHEQAGSRYAVVVQSDALPLSTVLVAPTSTVARTASFRPSIQVEGRPTAVLVEQTAAVDPGRLGPLIGHLSQRELAAVDAALAVVLDLSARH